MGIKRHVLRYLKQIFNATFWAATAASVALLAIGGIANCASGKENSMVDLLCGCAVMYGVMALGFGLFALKAVEFVEMIRKQEKLLSVTFDGDALEGHPKSRTCKSDDWLVLSGEYAFHRRYISKFRILHHYDRGVSGTFIFYTVDGLKYTCGFDEEQAFIVDWLKSSNPNNADLSGGGNGFSE